MGWGPGAGGHFLPGLHSGPTPVVTSSQTPTPNFRLQVSVAHPLPSGLPFWTRWLAAGAWAALIGALLWAAGPETPPAFAWLAAFERAGGDKLVHAALFAVQAWLLCRCRSEWRVPAWLLACFAVAVVYGVVTEAGQLLAAGRDATVGDALADAIGAGLGTAWAARRPRRG